MKEFKVGEVYRIDHSFIRVVLHITKVEPRGTKTLVSYEVEKYLGSNIGREEREGTFTSNSPMAHRLVLMPDYKKKKQVDKEVSDWLQ